MTKIAYVGLLVAESTAKKYAKIVKTNEKVMQERDEAIGGARAKDVVIAQQNATIDALTRDNAIKGERNRRLVERSERAESKVGFWRWGTVIAGCVGIVGGVIGGYLLGKNL